MVAAIRLDSRHVRGQPFGDGEVEMGIEMGVVSRYIRASCGGWVGNMLTLMSSPLASIAGMA